MQPWQRSAVEIGLKVLDIYPIAIIQNARPHRCNVYWNATPCGFNNFSEVPWRPVKGQGEAVCQKLAIFSGTVSGIAMEGSMASNQVSPESLAMFPVIKNVF
ncbi:MAG: hypothetical protein Q9P14_06105 [candidate division KSB1 bacterium]|nr:hypothetical protein [candidate division KSB1 bacterium]MDQ7064817.1 hypothetical protein [candidate division KSB1 bacterium]